MLSQRFLYPSLRWRHNERDSVSNHQPHDCLLNRIFRRRSKEIIKAPRHWPLCGEFTGDRWIPRTNDQLRGKCFHLMTSSWWWIYVITAPRNGIIWWRNQMEIFSALLALCEKNPPVTGGFPSQRPVMRCVDDFFDLRLNKRLGKQSRRLWFKTPSHPL